MSKRVTYIIQPSKIHAQVKALGFKPARFGVRNRAYEMAFYQEAVNIYRTMAAKNGLTVSSDFAPIVRVRYGQGVHVTGEVDG